MRSPAPRPAVLLLLLAMAAVVLPVSSASASASASSGSAGSGSATRSAPSAAAVSVPSNAQQLITVNTDSAGATSGSLSAWERGSDGRWQRVFGPMTAWVGANGIGQASEGSKRTPAGTYPLTEAFGRQANPGTQMPYFVTDPLDWWDSNPASPTYNLHVRQQRSPGGASEHLQAIGALYDYAVNIGYNLARTPGAGSAFFLHVTGNRPTGGCVSIARSALADILRWLSPAKNPQIDIRVGAAATPDAAPLGSNDAASLDIASSSIVVSGWAFDPDQATVASDVHVYDRRPDGTVASIAVRADRRRDDVSAVYPGAGAGHGFSVALTSAVAGRHVLCAYAIDVGNPSTHTDLGCRNVDLPPPLGSLDAVGNPSPGVLSAVGWAADPLAAAVHSPVHVYAVGPTTVGVAVSTDQARADVLAAVPWTAVDAGWSATLGVSAAGTYQVCGYAIAVRTGDQHTAIGCRTQVIRDVFGAFDTAAMSGSSIRVTGWALNPNNPGSRVAVHVYDLGPDGVVRGFVLTAERPRGDVAAAYPGYDTGHGFTGTFPSGVAGTHIVCAYGINADGGSATNPQLGCRQVVVG